MTDVWFFETDVTNSLTTVMNFDKNNFFDFFWNIKCLMFFGLEDLTTTWLLPSPRLGQRGNGKEGIFLINDEESKICNYTYNILYI